MANSVKLKRSSVSGKVPTTADLELGELAINTHDGKIFIKTDDGSGTIDIITVGQESISVNGDTMQGDLDMNNHQITSVADPTNTGDATNKGYVDALVSGLKWKNTVKAATTTNIDLDGTETIDGISCGVGDRVLVMSQTDETENGIYVVSSSAWSRATDFDSLTPIDEINGAAVYVEQGTTNGDVAFTVTSQVDTLGSDDIIFAQFSGSSSITVGDGLTQSGNTISVLSDGTTITVSSSGIKVSDATINTINGKLDATAQATDSAQLDGEDPSYYQNNHWIIVTNNYTASANDKIMADTSSSTFTITLPSSPSLGDTVEFIDASGTHQTNNLTVARNGQPIMGGTTDLICDVEDARWKMTYYNSTEGWKIN